MNIESAMFKGNFGINTATKLSKVKSIETVDFTKINGLDVNDADHFQAQIQEDSSTEDDDASAKRDGSDSDSDSDSDLPSCACCYATDDTTDGYDTIANMPFLKSFAVRKEFSAVFLVDATKMANHKDEIEEAMEELKAIRAFPFTDKNWMSFLSTYEGYYDFFDALILHDGNRKLIHISRTIVYSEDDEEEADNATDSKWTTPRKTFLIMSALKDAYSAGPPPPATLAAMEAGMKAPFRRPEYFGEVNELKQELGYIAAITASKERVGLLAQQVSLSLLFGVSSFMATLIYDSIDFSNSTLFSDDDEYSPIVDELQALSGDSPVLRNIEGTLQQQMVNQQQIIQLLTGAGKLLTDVAALLNTTE